MIKVLVAGACGRMGREVVRAVSADQELTLVAAVDACEVGKDAGELAGVGVAGVKISDDLESAIADAGPDVMIDFTHAKAAKSNVLKGLRRGVHAVVGTTGLSETDLKEIEREALSAGTNVFIAPNFAIGAVLMMRLAEMAAQYLPAVEIIELHHDKKADAPSGTALLTAKKLASIVVRREEQTKKIALEGSRGGDFEGIHVHSIRLPGLVAHQEVIFGGTGQTLTIRHDSIDRSSFMPGVLMAAKAVVGLRGLTVGLENIL